MSDATQFDVMPPREMARTRRDWFRAVMTVVGLVVSVAATFTSSSVLAQDGTWDTSWIPHDSNQKGFPGLFEDLYSLGGGGSFANDMTATSTVVQTDGKVLVAGFGWITYNGTDQNACIVRRYNADGSVDTSFGNAGSAVQKFSEDGGTDPKIDCYFDAMALQPDGKIVVVGQLAYAQAGVTPSGLVMRLNANGSNDGSFGDSGSYSYFALNFTQVLVLGSGEIAVVGTYHAQNFQDTDFYLGILDPNGHLQYYRAAHFDLGGDKNDTPGAAVAEHWFSLGPTFHSYEEIYLAGIADNSPYVSGLAHHKCAIAAFRRADGDSFALDTAFGNSGQTTADFPVGSSDTDTICRSAAPRPGGLIGPYGIVVGGERYYTPNNASQGSASYYALEEIDAGGSVMRRDNFAYFADLNEPGAFNSINSMVWDNLGKLVTVGYAGIGANGDQTHAPSDGVIRRFNADYSVDGTFAADHSGTLFASLDTTGAAGILQSQREWINTVAADPLHGRVVFAGERSPWLAAFPDRYAWFLGAVRDGNVVISDRIFANGFD